MSFNRFMASLETLNKVLNGIVVAFSEKNHQIDKCLAWKLDTKVIAKDKLLTLIWVGF